MNLFNKISVSGEVIGWVTLMVTLIGGFVMLDSKIDRLSELQCARTDKLYEMFIDLVKETRKS
jgi:hypothetical protein